MGEMTFVDLLVVGGGPAGLLAARRFASTEERATCYWCRLTLRCLRPAAAVENLPAG
jgi:ribulose 1,5-bisphosphate synthetase/thiazole synthase